MLKHICLSIILSSIIMSVSVLYASDSNSLDIRKPAPLTLQKNTSVSTQDAGGGQGFSFNLSAEQEKCDKGTYSFRPVATLLMDGKPLDGESIMLEIRSIPWGTRTSTGADGKTKSGLCEFDPVQGKTYKLLATSRGQTKEITLNPAGVCAEANKNFSFSISLEQENCDTGSYSVSPVVTTLLDGKPVAGESVLFEIRSMQFGARLKTLENGKTMGLTKTFEPLEGKTYKLEVTVRSQKREVILNPAEACHETNKNFTIGLTLENEKCVSGKYSVNPVVTVLMNGKPVANETVNMEVRSIPWGSSTRTGANGKTKGTTFSVDAIQGKTYKLTVKARGKIKEVTIDTKKTCGW